MKKHLLLCIGLMGLAVSACETTPKPSPSEPPIAEPIPSPIPSPTPNPIPGPTPIPGPEPTLPGETPPQVIIPPIEPPSTGGPGGNPNFKSIRGWRDADVRSALISFQRSCRKITKMSSDDYLSKALPQYGRASDWQNSCAMAQATPAHDNEIAKNFFEDEFLPAVLTQNGAAGMVTGYYQPEINARRVKDSIYSEAILSVPSSKAVLTWPRSQISESSATPIAYGKPIDVFFMQIQGSGVLVFDNGEKIRAAYANNNGHSYTSIGRLLVERGELLKDKASKQDIESWMAKAGPVKSRALMNDNARYIFFQAEPILPGEGPKGAMRVPLTDMASIAVDPSFYPYGLPFWLETKIPSGKGDYKGRDENLLVISQDTGKAIRGAFRADLYFGSGFVAGDKAGVMKHPASWTVLLPLQLALQLASKS